MTQKSKRILVVLVLALLLGAPAQADPSSYSDQRGGARVLYLLLEELGYRVSRSQHFARADAAADVAILLGESRDEDDVLKWVRAGHVLVWALPWVGARVCGVGVGSGEATFRRRWRLEGQPMPAGGEHGDLKFRKTSCCLEVPSGGRALAGTDEAALAVELPLGRGSLLVLAYEDLLVNERLGRDDIAVLLRRWLSAHAPARARVTFLEGGGGGGEGLLALARRMNLTVFLVHALLGVLLLYWSKAPRFGDARPVFGSTRREFSQHARALGHLYQRQHASAQALQYQYERFLERVCGRVELGRGRMAQRRGQVRGDPAALSQLIATRSGQPLAHVERLLAEVEQAVSSPAPGDAKEAARHFRLSQALAALQGTSAVERRRRREHRGNAQAR